MKRRLLHNWQAKMVCFFMAIILWCALKQKIEPGALTRAFGAPEAAAVK